MFRFLLIIILIPIALGCTGKAEKQEIFKKTENPEIVQFTPKKPTRIKLKRTSNGVYSWELTGDDVEEIIKINKRLEDYTRVDSNK